MNNPNKWTRDRMREAHQRGLVHISDHALVRFLERAGGHEIDAIRNALAASLKRSADAAKLIGTADYDVLADGLRYVIKRNCLITVLPESSPSPSQSKVLVG